MRCNSIVDAIGGTPLVRLNRLGCAQSATVWVKLEGLNPGGSVKVRPAVRMVTQARRDGRLGPDGILVEATSGNLGVALSMVGAALGHPVKIMVDPRTPGFTVRCITAYGADATLVDQPDEHGKFQIPRIRAAEAEVARHPAAFMPDQWSNPANPAAHADGTAAEIVADLDGRIDAVVCTTSSCGQVTGIGRALRESNPDCLIVAVDGQGSTAIGGPMGKHLLVGLGSGFTPENFDATLIDQAYWCGDAEAFSTCRLLATEEGMLLGGSSGAAVFVAMRVAQLLGPDANVVAIAPDGGDRYLDTIYDDGWWEQHRLTRYATREQLRERLAHYDPVPGTELAPWRRLPRRAGTADVPAS